MRDGLGDLASFTKGELAKIATEKWIGKTTVAITDAIEHSFRTDVVLRPVKTKAEIERRFKITAKIVVLLRRDLGWSMPRILDELRHALRCQLDGAPWNPEDKRKMWADGGAGMPLVNTGEKL